MEAENKSISVFFCSNANRYISILKALSFQRCFVPDVVFFLGLGGISQICLILHAERTAFYFIKISFPNYLLPFFKAWHYLIGSILTVSEAGDLEKSKAYADKIQIDELITDKNKFICYGHLASLYDREKATFFLDLANRTPHNEFMQEKLTTISSKITEHQE